MLAYFSRKKILLCGTITMELMIKMFAGTKGGWICWWDRLWLFDIGQFIMYARVRRVYIHMMKIDPIAVLISSKLGKTEAFAAWRRLCGTFIQVYAWSGDRSSWRILRKWLHASNAHLTLACSINCPNTGDRCLILHLRDYMFVSLHFILDCLLDVNKVQIVWQRSPENIIRARSR